MDDQSFSGFLVQRGKVVGRRTVAFSAPPRSYFLAKAALSLDGLGRFGSRGQTPDPRPVVIPLATSQFRRCNSSSSTVVECLLNIRTSESMKTRLLASVALLLLALSATAQTTYSVIKVSAALTGAAQGTDFVTLVPTTFTTKILINIALDKEITTPVPKNIVLAYAGDFAAFGHNTPDPTSPVQLVVYDTDAQAKLKTIATASNRTIVENRFAANKFKRVGFGTLTVADTSAGATNSFFTGGTLQIAGTVVRKPNGVATPANLTVTGITSVLGTLQATYKKGSTVTSGTFVITKGTLKGAGKILGTFTE